MRIRLAVTIYVLYDIAYIQNLAGTSLSPSTGNASLPLRGPDPFQIASYPSDNPRQRRDFKRARPKAGRNLS